MSNLYVQDGAEGRGGAGEGEAAQPAGRLPLPGEAEVLAAAAVGQRVAAGGAGRGLVWGHGQAGGAVPVGPGGGGGRQAEGGGAGGGAGWGGWRGRPTGYRHLQQTFFYLAYILGNDYSWHSNKWLFECCGYPREEVVGWGRPARQPSLQHARTALLPSRRGLYL